MKPNEKVIILDCNAICYGSVFAMPNLSSEDRPTAVIFGFFKALAGYAKLFNTNRFAFCWDSRISKRRKRFPFYKQRIKGDDPAMDELMNIAYPQFETLREYVLPKIGFTNNFYQEGHEADDLIAAFGQTNPHLNMTVVSSDEDLYQLLSMMSMYKPVKKILYTAKSLREEHNVSPEEWVMMKQLMGCSSDTIPGIYRVGPATASKYIRGTLSGAKLKMIDLPENQFIVDRNRWLVKLPLYGTMAAVYQPDTLILENFIDVCTEYDFRSILDGKDYVWWVEHFNMG